MDKFEVWEERLYPSLVDNIDYIIKNTPHNGVFYDIGANTGLLSKKVYEQRPDIHYVLFEPVKEYYERACYTFKNVEKAICINAALIEENKEIEISIDSNNLGWNTLSFVSNYGRKEKVFGITLYDAYVDNKLPLPDMIKIDAEESESYVIEGAKELFNLGLPKNILIEVGVNKTHPLWEREFNMIEYLFSLGYKRFDNDYNTVFDAKFEL